jgi:lipopolysaccharide transport system permease protein
MTGVIEGFRWALVGGAGVPVMLVALSVAVTVVLFVAGVAYFGRLERTFADVV